MSYFIIIRGPLGSGKTTIAKKLAKTLKAGYFEIDQIIEQHYLYRDIEGGYISRKSFLRANEIVLPKIEKLLKQGTPVVIDGNFYWKTQITDLINRLKYPHFVFTLIAPLKTCIKWDSERKQPYGKAAVKAVYKKTTKINCGTAIDASKTVKKTIEEIQLKLCK